ncbi:MAG: hypothetical protein V4663_14720 [Bacteroidota bacterium]
MIKISNIAFRKLYNDFTNEVWNTELTDAQKASIRKIGLDLWLLTAAGQKGDNFYERIFKNLDVTRKHFYNKLSSIRSSDSKKVPMNEEVLCRMLKYIGVDIPEGTPKHLWNDEIKQANFLYNLYLKTFEADEFYTNINAEMLSTYQSKVKIGRESKASNDKIEMAINESVTHHENKNVLIVVNSFYQAISASNLEEAWKMLSPTFQNRVWHGQFEDFAIGYHYSISVNNVHVWDIRIEDYTANCKVYFEDVVDTFTSDELGNIDKLTLSNIDKFCTRLKALLEKSASTTLNGLEKIEIHKFFEPAVSEYIWYRCGRNPEAIQELLESRSVQSIPRLYNISCAKIDENWLIKGISPIRNGLYR